MSSSAEGTDNLSKTCLIEMNGLRQLKTVNYITSCSSDSFANYVSIHENSSCLGSISCFDTAVVNPGIVSRFTFNFSYLALL